MNAVPQSTSTEYYIMIWWNLNRNKRSSIEERRETKWTRIDILRANSWSPAIETADREYRKYWLQRRRTSQQKHSTSRWPDAELRWSKCTLHSNKQSPVPRKISRIERYIFRSPIHAFEQCFVSTRPTTWNASKCWGYWEQSRRSEPTQLHKPCRRRLHRHKQPGVSCEITESRWRPSWIVVNKRTVLFWIEQEVSRISTLLMIPNNEAYNLLYNFLLRILFYT